MVPRPLAPAQAMRSRTCAHVIQPCCGRMVLALVLGTSVSEAWARIPALPSCIFASRVGRFKTPYESNLFISYD